MEKLSMLDLEAGDDLLEVPVAASAGVTLIDLARDTCRWPLELNEDDERLFCAASTDGAYPYCATHVCVAYVRARPRHR
jgi:hypothetical protein